MKRVVFGALAVLLVSSNVGAQQFPIADKVADKVVQKYRNSSCGQLMAQHDQPRSPEEKRAIQLLHDDPQLRRQFIDRIAAPVANKLFECGMVP